MTDKEIRLDQQTKQNGHSLDAVLRAVKCILFTFYESSLTGVLLLKSLPATSDQPISSGCVVNDDDIITMTTAMTLRSYPTVNGISTRQQHLDFSI